MQTNKKLAIIISIIIVLIIIINIFVGMGSWNTEIIEQGIHNIVRETSLALDNDGVSHIFYLNAGTLKYAKEIDNNWVIETIDEGDNEISISELSNIAIDEYGNPHIAYYVGYQVDVMIKYAYYTGNEWIKEIVNNNLSLTSRLSLQLDNEGNPHICYANLDIYAYGSIMYATKEDSNWKLESTIIEGEPIHPFLVLDNNDTPYICYSGGVDDDIRLAKRIDGNWSMEIIDSGSLFSFPSLVIDEQGTLHISYFEYNQVDGIYNGDFRYDSRVGNDWVIEIVDAESITYLPNHIVLDGNIPIICYSDYNSEHIKFARNVDGIWEIKNMAININIDSSFGIGIEPSFDIDKNGYAHACYLRINNDPNSSEITQAPSYDLVYLTEKSSEILLLQWISLLILVIMTVFLFVLIRKNKTQK